MRYTIHGFSQKRLIELGLDDRDALILRYFIDFKDAGGMVKRHFDNDEPFYWFQYDGFLEEYPILRKSKTWSKDTVYRRLKKMADRGVLQHRTRRKGGTFSYYAIGKKYRSLLSNLPINDTILPIDGSDSNPKGSDSNPKGSDSNPKGSDSNPKGSDSNPKGSDSNPELKINLLHPSTTSHPLHPSIKSHVCPPADQHVSPPIPPTIVSTNLDVCHVCLKDFKTKPQSERLQILENILNTDCRNRNKPEIRISQILRYIVGKHGVSELVILDAIQRIATSGFRVKTSFYALLVANRNDLIFQNGQCVFRTHIPEPDDQTTIAHLQAIEQAATQWHPQTISENDFMAANARLRQKQQRAERKL